MNTQTVTRSALAAALTTFAATAIASSEVPGQPVFYQHVLPILQENCQECHRPAGTNFGGMVAPMSLISFDETRPWAKSIAREVAARKMPPWHADPEFHGVFANERSLTPAEIETLVRWANTGARPGNPQDAPPPKSFQNHEGWMIGEPDLIVPMPEPYHVDDDVDDLYTAFEVDLTSEQLPHDMWITAFQCKPGSKIIHHFNCHLLYPDEDGDLPPKRDTVISPDIAPRGAGQYIGGVSSGTDANLFPEGFGLLLKKGTRVTFDIHYHKEPGPGTGVVDLSHIGFKLSSTPPEREIGSPGPLMHFNINIAPGEKHYKIGPVSQVLNQDTEIISLMPHMHMRGSQAKFEYIYPSGDREVALFVPDYNFSWQTVYYYKTHKIVPKGTRIEYTAWYDNSPERAAQVGFDPNQRVTFGQKSTDEMMMGFIMSAPVPGTRNPDS